MKLTIKDSLGKLQHINVRVPTSLKSQLDVLRHRAEQQNIDYTATLVAVLQDFATQLEAQVTSRESQKNLTNGKSADPE